MQPYNKTPCWIFRSAYKCVLSLSSTLNDMRLDIHSKAIYHRSWLLHYLTVIFTSSFNTNLMNIYRQQLERHSEGWWEAWQPSPRLPGAISGQRQSWKTPGELGVSKSMECDIFPFSALTLLVGRQEGHPACNNLDVGLLVVMIWWLELCTTYSSSCHHSPPPSSFASTNTG